jgi:DNA-binding NarL/FixJ family response regulator/PAS domain-containing protein
MARGGVAQRRQLVSRDRNPVLYDEDALRAAAERLGYQARLFENVPDAVIVTTDDGIVVGWNPRAEQLYAVGASEALGRPLTDVIDSGPATGVDVTRGVVNDGEGTPVGHLEIHRKTSDRPDGVHDLIVRLVDTSTSFIGIADLAGRPLYVNPAGLALVGLDDLAEAGRMTIVDFVAAEDRAFVREQVLPEALREGVWRSPRAIRLRHFRTDDLTPVLSETLRVDDPLTGEPVGIATVARDLRGTGWSTPQAGASRMRQAGLAELAFRALGGGGPAPLAEEAAALVVRVIGARAVIIRGVMPGGAPVHVEHGDGVGGDGVLDARSLPIGPAHAPFGELTAWPAAGGAFSLAELDFLESVAAVLASASAHDADPDPIATVRVVLVEDHLAVREAIAAAFDARHGFSIVGQAATMAEARGMLDDVDVAIVDLGLPDGYGGDLIAELKERNSEAHAIVLTAGLDRSETARAVESGAAAIFSKTEPLDEVVGAVRRLHDGETIIPLDEVVDLLRFASRSREREHADKRAIERLTEREIEVLQALAEGIDVQSIAKRLYITPRTARNHVASILSKLDVHSQLQAVVFAVRYGIVEISRPPARR